jgi:hypothetical protein
VLLARTPALPVRSTSPGRDLRTWIRDEHSIERAEEPDRPGRPRPRAPGRGCAASVR